MARLFREPGRGGSAGRGERCRPAGLLTAMSTWASGDRASTVTRDRTKPTLANDVTPPGGWLRFGACPLTWAMLGGAGGNPPGRWVPAPYAAFGLLNPIIAAAAMALSSLSVIVNSATLKGLRIDKLTSAH